MSSDFFKKLQPLFEDKDEKSVSNLRESATRQENVAKEHKKLDAARKAKKEAARKAADTEQSDREYIAQRQKKEAEKKAEKPANVKENAVDFFRKYSDIVTEAESVTDPLVAKLFAELKSAGIGLAWDNKRLEFSEKDNDAVWDVYSKYMNTLRSKGWNASNIEQSTTPGMKYITLQKQGVTESYADDDEDPDVAKAMSVKGKDGKKQTDVEKVKKWSFDKKLDKADKSAEDKAAKKVAKDKDLTEAKKSKDSIKAEIKATNDKIDSIVKDGGKVTLTDPLTVKLNKLKKQLTAVNESWDDDDDEDPDVAKADAVKGKDGKTQKDADKKLPPWLKKGIDKADKKGEDKGVAKAKKDKDLTESAVPRKVSRHSLEVDGVNQDDPEDGQAFFSYGEYTDGTPLSQEKLAQLTSKYRDIVDIKAFASVKGGDWDHDAWGDDVELDEGMWDKVNSAVGKIANKVGISGPELGAKFDSGAAKLKNVKAAITNSPADRDSAKAASLKAASSRTFASGKDDPRVAKHRGDAISHDYTESVEETSLGRKWVKNADLNKKPASKIEEGANKYQHIQNEVRDMDKMSPEQLQSYADFLRRELNKMKSWIRNEFSDSYANLKKDPDESGHWSVKMCDEYIQELKAAKARGAIVTPSGGAKASTSIRSDSRGAIGGGFTR